MIDSNTAIWEAVFQLRSIVNNVETETLSKEILEEILQKLEILARKIDIMKLLNENDEKVFEVWDFINGFIDDYGHY